MKQASMYECSTTSAANAADMELARFFYANAIPFNVTHSITHSITHAIELWFHLLMSPSCHVPVMRRLMQKRHVSRDKNREAL